MVEEVGLGFEAGTDAVQRIEQLEVRIEELREAIERSRRLMLAGRACAALGPALFVFALFGLVGFTPFGTIIGIALFMGGLVLMGSSKASTEGLEFSLRQTEEERSAAIDALELVQFGD
jgi:small neutral amino acid transporter SnatA (MarC family)